MTASHVWNYTVGSGNITKQGHHFLCICFYGFASHVIISTNKNKNIYKNKKQSINLQSGIQPNRAWQHHETLFHTWARGWLQDYMMVKEYLKCTLLSHNDLQRRVVRHYKGKILSLLAWDLPTWGNLPHVERPNNCFLL